MAELPLSFQSYLSRSAPFSAQRLVNLFCEMGVPGTKSSLILYNRPGLTTFSTAGAGPVRGMQEQLEVPFIVSGTEVYTLDSGGTSTKIGDIPGTDIVNMSHNATQMAIVAGTSGYIARAAQSDVIDGVADAAVSGTINAVSDNGSGKASFTTAAAHGMFVNQSVTNAGCADAAYNGTFTITAVPDATSYAISAITYTATDTGTFSSDSITITSPVHGLADERVVTIAGTNDYDGTFTIYNGTLNTYQVNETFVSSESGTWSTAADVQQITDENFPEVSSVTYQAGYFIWSIANSGEFQLSPLNDGLGPYDPLDRATSEFNPDHLIAVFSDHDDLFLMGEDTIEPWYNSGAVDFPFIRNQGSVMEVGLTARDTVAKIDNSMFWLGNAGERGGKQVWRAQGYTPIRISTHALEREWEKASVADIEASHAITFRMEGHEFYVLTIPNLGTYVYDASTQLWCEWEQKGTIGWNVVGYTDAFGLRLFGSGTDGKILSANVDVYTDNDTPIEWEATSPAIATENNELARHNFVRIDVESGVGLTTGQGSDPKISIQWSEDGVDFNNLKELSMGKQGDRGRRAYLRRLGISRSRIYRIRGSDPVKTAILGAYIDVKPGRW